MKQIIRYWEEATDVEFWFIALDGLERFLVVTKVEFSDILSQEVNIVFRNSFNQVFDRIGPLKLSYFSSVGMRSEIFEEYFWWYSPTHSI